MTIYAKELEIKDPTDAPKWAGYLDLHLDSDKDGKRFTRLYDKRDDFDFLIVNFPYISSNIPEYPAHGVFVSQLIRNQIIYSKTNQIQELIMKSINSIKISSW